MKKYALIFALVLLLFGLSVSHAEEKALPQEILSALSGQIGPHCFAGEDECFVLTREGSKHTLHLFTKTDGKFRLTFSNGQILPEKGTNYFLSYADSAQDMFSEQVIAPAVTIGYAPDDKEAAFTVTLTRDKKGNWIVYHINQPDTGTLHATLKENAIFYTDEVNAFPGMRAMVFVQPERSAATFRTALIEDDTDTLLSACFPGSEKLPSYLTGDDARVNMLLVQMNEDETFPVYSGPGQAYYRAANGKACFSGNDWIGVLGKTDDYLMVIYQVKDFKMRVGWVNMKLDAKLMQAADYVEEFFFRSTYSELGVKTSLYDDPVYKTEPLHTFKAHTQYQYWLGSLSDSQLRFGDWIYIEITVNGQKMCGFVPFDSIING